MPADDVQLVGGCLRGETDAVQALIGRYQANVFGLCVRLLHHRHDAEDVTQEVFLRVFRSLRRWDSKRPLKPWIMGIAVNRCRTWLKQRARCPELVPYLQETADDSKIVDDASELVREIQLALNGLRLEYKTVFVLFHEQRQAYEDIARTLRRPVGTVKTWLHRARLEVLEKLRERRMIAEVDNDLS